MAGISTTRTSSSMGAEQYLENVLEEVEAETGMELNHFDSFEVDPNLPESIAAQTAQREIKNPLTGNTAYSETRLIANDNLLYEPVHRQKETLGHEGIHAADFNDQLIPQLQDRGVSTDTARFLDSKLNGSRRDMEGATEFINQALQPDSYHSRAAYPYETAKVKKDAEMKGIDLESELEPEADSEISAEIGDYIDEIYTEFGVEPEREVYGKAAGEHFYRELGQIGDTVYDITIIGADAGDYGEELADQYLKGLDYGTGSYDVEYGEGENGFDSPIEDDVGVPSLP